MHTKIDVVNSAYSKMRINGLTVQPTPEDLELALFRFEDLMEEFYGLTMNVGYFFEEHPNPNTPTGVERKHNNMMSSNLATRLCIDFGKDIPPKLGIEASTTYSGSVAIVSRDRLQQVANPARMPRGSGNRGFNRWRRFYPQTIVPITDARNEEMFQGDINDFKENFVTYLQTHGGQIDTFDIKTTKGLHIVSSALNAGRDEIIYRVEARGNDNVYLSGVEVITLTVITTTGRIESRQRVFEVEPLTPDTTVTATPPPTFSGTIVPHNFNDTCTINCDTAFGVDWGDGNLIDYPAGDASAVPSANITVQSIGVDITQIVFDTDTYKTINLIDSSTLTSMNSICAGLSTLEEFDVADASNVTDFQNAWQNCAGLVSFPLIDVSSASALSATWGACTGLTTFPAIDTSGISAFTSTWNGCSGLLSFPLLNTSGATSMFSTWSGCSSLATFPLLSTAGVSTFEGAWGGCTSLLSFPLINTFNALSFENTWNGCTGLLTFPALTSGNVTTLRQAWFGCAGLSAFPLIDTSSVTDFFFAWNGCSGLTSFPLISVAGAVNVYSAWVNCTGLTSFPLIDFTGILAIGSAWLGCTGLLSMPAIDTSSVQDFSQAFYGCTSLICLSTLNTLNQTNTTDLFFNTVALVAPDGTEQTALLAGSNYINASPCP